MSHQHQSLLDRRPRAAQLAVVLYELCTVLSACKHPYGLLVCGGCLNPLRSTGCRVVPIHLCVLLPEKDDASDVYPMLRAPKRLLWRFWRSFLFPPLLTRGRGREIPRTSPKRSSKKFASFAEDSSPQSLGNLP